MEGTGMVRKVDQLGRIVLPKELRKTRGFDDGTKLEIILLSDDEIKLKKYKPGCHFCGSTEKLTKFKGNNICEDCLNELR